MLSESGRERERSMLLVIAAALPFIYPLFIYKEGRDGLIKREASRVVSERGKLF